MHKIISLLFLSYFIAIEGRISFPIQPRSDDTNNSATAVEKINYRLNENVIPNHYKIELTTHLLDKNEKNRVNFEGKVSIDLTVKEDTTEFAFHARDLKFGFRKMLLKPKEGGEDINNMADDPDTKRDLRFFKVLEKDKIKKGDYTLNIEYTGTLDHKDFRGFYNSSYKNGDAEVMLATTHFEPLGARRAFPCFDEPSFKATFDLTLIHDKTLHAISNTEGKATTVGDTATTVFKTTPKMSTYLLAFIVSDFGELSNEPEGNFKIHARKEVIKDGQLALDEGQKLLKKLEEVTGIAFGESGIYKMDQAAIPDFPAGAMENWGLVTYKEASLLFKEGETTTSAKQNIIETIAHEFAHQWFGDLVSPKWWKYLWLNEGFANFFQSYITEKVDPEWQSINQAVVKSIQTSAFDVDSSSMTHPINQDVESPEEISAIFDDITYKKGGAVIRMMQHFLTDEVFLKGLNDYLNAKKFNVADSDDLFKALAKASENKIDVTKVMDSWVNHKGYPVVTLKRNYDENKYVLTQERFFSYDASEEEKKNKTLWNIPINIARSDNFDFSDTKPDFWLDKESEERESDYGTLEAIILNKQQTGFYRVNYDENNWDYIAQALVTNTSQIHVLNRAQLVNDAFAFVKQGMMNISTMMRLTAYLEKEGSYIAWYPAFKAFSWMKSKLFNSEHYPFFKSHILNVTKNLVGNLTYEEAAKEDYVTKLNRVTALNFVCSLGHKGCHDEMKEKLKKWLNDEAKYPLKADLKQITLCNGLRSADLALWTDVYEKYEKAPKSDRAQFITALACSENRDLLNNFLNETLKKDEKDFQIESVINAVRENSEIGPDVILEFMVKNSLDVYRRINKDDETMKKLFTSLSTKLTTTEQLAKLQATREKGISEDFIEKAVKTASENIEWIKKHEEQILTWKEEQKKEEEQKNNGNNGVGATSASISLLSSLLVVILVTLK